MNLSNQEKAKGDQNLIQWLETAKLGDVYPAIHIRWAGNVQKLEPDMSLDVEERVSRNIKHLSRIAEEKFVRVLKGVGITNRANVTMFAGLNAASVENISAGQISQLLASDEVKEISDWPMSQENILKTSRNKESWVQRGDGPNNQNPNDGPDRERYTGIG